MHRRTRKNPTRREKRDALKKELRKYGWGPEDLDHKSVRELFDLRELSIEKHGKSPQKRSGTSRFGQSKRSAPKGPPRIPNDYTVMGAGDLDYNEEIALSEDGVYAYKIIGRVAEHDSPKNELMWNAVRKQGRRQLTRKDVDKYFSLPEGFYPEASLIGVGVNGGYNVYLLNEEDIAARKLEKGLSSAKEAEALAKEHLAHARRGRFDARIISRSNRKGPRRV